MGYQPVCLEYLYGNSLYPHYPQSPLDLLQCKIRASHMSQDTYSNTSASLSAANWPHRESKHLVLNVGVVAIDTYSCPGCAPVETMWYTFYAVLDSNAGLGGSILLALFCKFIRLGCNLPYTLGMCSRTWRNSRHSGAMNGNS